MNNTEYFKRYEGLLDWEHLQSKHVLIVGAGSVGAPLAEELIRLSIRVTLIDLPGELIEAHNIVRHIVSRGALGLAKLQAVEEHIRALHPDAPLTSIGMDVVKEQEKLRELVRVSRPDVIVVATDNQESRFAVDAVARDAGIPLIGGGIYDGGIGGDLYKSDPYSPCYACVSHTLRGDGYGVQRRERSVNYENPDWNEFRATLALRFDILLITNLFGRWTLQTLLQGSTTADFGIPGAANVILYAMRRVPGLFKEPLRATALRVFPRPDCLVCGVGKEAASNTPIPEIPELSKCDGAAAIPGLEP